MSLRVGTSGNKIQVVRLGRLHGGAERTEPRICHRSRRQPVVQVSVVSRSVGKIARVERTPPAALELQSVDDGWVGHQWHFLPEPVLKDAGYERPLRVHSRLPFHQRSYRQYLMHILFQSHLAGHNAKTPDHGCSNLRRTCLSFKTISIRKQIALQTFCLGVQIGYQFHLFHRGIQKFLTRAKPTLLHTRCYVEYVCALRDSQGPCKYVSTRNPRINFGDRRLVVEAVLAGPEFAPLPKPEQVKDILAAHNSCGFQLTADQGCGGTWGKFNKGFGFRPVWGQSQPDHPAGCKKRKQKNPQQDCRSARSLLLPAHRFAARHPVSVDPS